MCDAEALAPGIDLVPRSPGDRAILHGRGAIRHRRSASRLRRDSTRADTSKSIDTHGQQITEAYRAVDKHVDRFRIAGCDVLLMVEENRPVPVVDHGEWAQPGTTALEVVSDHLWMVNNA